jgi:putative ABC transport system ATP-binding protein
MKISIKDIIFRYPHSDFKLSVDALELKQGNKTALIGPSGSGKTTFLNLVAGIIHAEEGRMILDDVNLQMLNARQTRAYRIENIGFVFQDFKLIPYLNVYENIIIPIRISNQKQTDRTLDARVKELARFSGIHQHLRKYPSKLSHGEKQRVAICRAIINHPKLILADEPTGNLDPVNKKKIMDLIIRYCTNHGASLITVTHDHDLLSEFDETIDFATFYETKDVE